MEERRKEVFSFHEPSFIVMTEPWTNLIVGWKSNASVLYKFEKLVSFYVLHKNLSVVLLSSLEIGLEMLMDKSNAEVDEKNVKWHLQGKERRMKEAGIKKFLIWKCWLKKKMLQTLEWHKFILLENVSSIKQDIILVLLNFIYWFYSI